MWENVYVKVDIKKFQGDIYQIDVMMEGKTSRMACYYIDSRDPILVEVGPSNSFPYLIAGLDSLGISNIKRTAIRKNRKSIGYKWIW